MTMLVNSFRFAGGWDVSKAVYTSKFKDVSAETTQPYGLMFSSDGTKAYVMNSSETIYQYTLSTAWDASTASYASKSKDVSAEGFMRYFAFSSDGTKMYAVDGNVNDTIYQYTLSTAWDISTASYASKSKDLSAEEGGPSSVVFNNDGTKMYILGQINDFIYQYTLSTAWDVSTASYASKFLDASSQQVSQGMAINPSGTALFAVSFDDTVYQYTLSTPWDVSTGSYSGKFKDASSEDNSINGLFFRPNGKSMYLSGNENNKIYQYSL